MWMVIRKRQEEKQRRNYQVKETTFPYQKGKGGGGQLPIWGVESNRATGQLMRWWAAADAASIELSWCSRARMHVSESVP